MGNTGKTATSHVTSHEVKAEVCLSCDRIIAATNATVITLNKTVIKCEASSLHMFVKLKKVNQLHACS